MESYEVQLKDFKKAEQELTGKERVFISQDNNTRSTTIDEIRKPLAEQLNDNTQKIDKIANNQIPEEYLQKSVAEYIKTNEAGLATDEDVFIINEYLKSISEEKEVPLDDENGNEFLSALIRVIKTDKTLLNELLPANAKATGEKILEEANRIRDETKLKVEYFSSQIFNGYEFGIKVLKLYGDMEGMSGSEKKKFSYSFLNKSGTCEMKWQGSSSMAYPKKNFTITFDNEIMANEKWGMHKKYCLKANFIDCSHARNIVSAKLWGQIVKNNRYNDVINLTFSDGTNWTDEKNNILTTNSNNLVNLINGGAIDGFPVILSLNDEFYGLYTFNIPKDAWMFGMDRLLNNSCGIITSENWSSLFDKLAIFNDEDYSIEYSANKDSALLKDSFNTLIQKVIDCTSKELYDDLCQNYIDIKSVIDYAILQLLITGSDCIKNLIYGTYDGIKFFVSAYDMDTTYGNHWTGTQYYYDDYNDIKKWSTHNLFKLMLLYDKEQFKNRYRELRKTTMNEHQITYMFSNFICEIPQVLLIEDWKKWCLVPGTTSNNLSQIVNQYGLRCKIIDDQIEKL